jgi:1-acyl-sn-glycerol-3-phosphate acyltransferase
VIFLRSLIFNILIYLGIIFSCLIGIPLLILPSIYLRKLSSFLGWYFIFMSRVILNAKVNTSGIEKLNTTQSFFIASSHQSMFETFAYNYFIPNGFFILKKELMNIPLFGLYLKKLNCVSIDRGKTTKENLNFSDKVIDNINNGKTLIIFPQGTRVPHNERVPIKKGVRRIYVNLKISCLPIKLNTGKVWPKNSFLKYPGEINFIFKDIIEPNLTGDDFIKALEFALYE